MDLRPMTKIIWRALRAGGGLVVLAGAMLSAGCFTPAVVQSAHQEGWTLEASRYPKDSTVVEVAGIDANGNPAPTLRGLFVPSDTGAPVVVHFAEASGSITSSLHTRGQYHDLAELGFASLAVDYRGVGLSDGETETRALDDDALAIWNHALEMVDGDSSRLLVRGCSLGTVAGSTLLERGIRPAAFIAIAPVRPQTVVKLYGYARFWNAPVWVLDQFLRTFSSGDPLRWIGEPGVASFVIAHPDDELLGKRDFERLRARVEASGGVFEVPKRLSVFLIGGDPIMEALKKHIGLSLWSFAIYPKERAFLADQFPGVPNLEERRENILRLSSRDAARAFGSDEGQLRRLDRILIGHRSAAPDLVLAAAHEWTDEEIESFDAWFFPSGTNEAGDGYSQRPYAELLELVSLEDPGGRLPMDMILSARSLLGSNLGSADARRWDKARLEGFLHAFLGEEVPGEVFASEGSQLGEGESWRFGVEENGRVAFAQRIPPVTSSGTMNVEDLAAAFAADAEGRTGPEARRRLRLCLTKAAGITE